MVYRKGYVHGMASLGKLTLSKRLDALMAIAASASQSFDAVSLTRCAADAMGASHCSIVLLFELRGEQPQIKLWGCRRGCPDIAWRDVLHCPGKAADARKAALSEGPVRPLLRTGALDGVLSSGDGAIGRSFHGELPNFAEIHYAFPVSFVVMSQTRYNALPDEWRVQLDKAALSIQVLNPMRRVS